MPTGYTQVSGSSLKDSTDTLVANATISFQPVSNAGAPISFRAGGGGQTISKQVTATVTNGVFTIQLADTTLTTPVNVGYAVTVIDNLTGDSLLGAGYGCVQPSGATWNWDNYDPDLDAQVTVQYGPSAYELAVTTGYVGTEAQWLASLQGPPGPVTAVASLAGQTSPYNIPTIPSGSGNVYVTIPAADSSDQHIVGLPASDIGTIVYLQNVGTGTPYVATGNGNYARPRPGEMLTLVRVGDFWKVVGQVYYRQGSLSGGDSYQMPDNADYLYWNGNNGAIVNLPGTVLQGNKVTIANYGGNPVSVSNTGNQIIRNSPGDLVISPGETVVFDQISTNYWFISSTFPTAAPASFPATSITGVLNPSQVPGLDASKITSGVIDPARLPSTSGGSVGASTLSPNLFTAPQSFAMGPTTIPGITLYGDSITNGAGATTLSTTYAQLLRVQFNGTYLNASQGGDESCDLSLKAHTDSIPTTFNPTRTVFIGHNDVAFKGATSNALNNYVGSLTAAISYLAIPNYYKVFGQAGTLSGFAADSSLDGTVKPGMAVTATVSGSTVTIPIITTKANQPIYIGWYGADSNGGAASVSLDGSVVDNLTTQGPGGPINTTNGRHSTVWGKRYVVPSAGTHSLVIAVTSATASGNSFTFLWAGTPAPQLSLPGMPRVFVLDPIYQAGFSQQTVTDAYIAALSPLVAQLAADGLYVAHLPTNNYIDNATDMSFSSVTAPDGTVCPGSTTPGLHPNDCGMQHIANMVSGAAMPTTAPAVSQLLYGASVLNAGAAGNLNSPFVFINGTGTFTLPPGVLGSIMYVFNYGSGTIAVTPTKIGNKTLASNTGAMFANAGDGWLPIL